MARTTACLACACGLFVFESQGRAAPVTAGQSPAELTAQQAGARSRVIETEVVGLDLTGPLPFEKVLIADFDSMVTPSGEHLVPLRHLLEALQVDSQYTDGILTFSLKTTTGPIEVVVDPAAGVIRVSGQATNMVAVVGVSDLTRNEEVFVRADAVALGLRVRLEWDEQAFAFRGTTDHVFAMWEQFNDSLLAIKTTAMPTTLPELFPPATPGRLSLDFMELELRPYVTSSQSSAASATLAIDAPRESFWGSAFGGQYRFRVSQPAVTGTRAPTQAPVVLDRFEWTYTMPTAEIAVGDSTYGLSDLIFPVVRTTGVRVSGIAGMAGVKTSGRSPGMSTSFSRAQIFEGVAPNGSRVDLFLNGQPNQTQVVIAGRYRFEEVRLAPGTLNNVRITITEPGGLERVIERSIFGRSIQLPRRGFAHLGGVGTKRENRTWSTWGITAAERILYGVTDSLTIGAAFAGQQDSGPRAGGFAIDGGRGFPSSSLHRGGQVSWLPSEHLQLLGDTAFSSAQQGDASYSGRAYRVNADVFPRRDLRLSSQWFNYSPGFFNGDNLQLRDRAGYTFDVSWAINHRLRASSSGGSLRNGLDRTAVNPIHMAFQKVELMAGITPRLATIVSANRLVNAQGDAAAIVYNVRVQASPRSNVTADVSLSRGASLSRAVDPSLSSGLSIPGYSPYQLQQASANIRVALNSANSLSASYFHGPSGHRVSITESFSAAAIPIGLSTNAGYDARTGQPFFGQRSEYRLDRAGRKAIGFDLRYDVGHWTSMVNVTFSELFRNAGGGLKRMGDPSFTADNGAVYGKVFIDANANGMRDPREPGLDHVRVMSDNGIKTETDRDGNFVIPAEGQTASYRVSLDIDTLPAIYSPTNGIRTANVRSGNLTAIDFGVVPIHSVSGVVEMASAENVLRPMAGARVSLKRVTDGRESGDSVTGEDGGYFLSDIRPGRYTIQVDPRTLPTGTRVREGPLTIEIQPSVSSQDLRVSPSIVQ